MGLKKIFICKEEPCWLLRFCLSPLVFIRKKGFWGWISGTNK